MLREYQFGKGSTRVGLGYQITRNTVYLWLLFLVAGFELLLQTLTDLSLAQLAVGFDDTLSEAL